MWCNAPRCTTGVLPAYCGTKQAAEKVLKFFEICRDALAFGLFRRAISRTLSDCFSFRASIGYLLSVGPSRFSRGEQFLQPHQIRGRGVQPELPIHPPPPAQFCFSQTRRSLHPPKYLFDRFRFPLTE